MGDAVFQTVSVQKNGLAVSSRPRIQFNGDWLPEMGFINSALVQTLPEPDGFVFNLCDENIKYSDLFHCTREKGGTLIRVCLSNDRKAHEVGFVTTGNHILKSGLKMGDTLLAKCEYGCMRVRKISGNVRFAHVARTKNAHTGEPIPLASLRGDWLSNIGFTPDTLVTVETKTGCITFTAHNKAVIYRDIVRSCRQNKMKLIQVSTHTGAPLLKVEGCAHNAGFRIGDMFAAEYDNGLIKLQKFDPQKFGF